MKINKLEVILCIRKLYFAFLNVEMFIIIIIISISIISIITRFSDK
jgi:competence protein ComGC